MSGIRSAWDSSDKDTKYQRDFVHLIKEDSKLSSGHLCRLEILCCHSHSMTPGTCKTEILKSDSDSNFDLNDKLYTFPLQAKTPLKVVTNIETFYNNG